MRSLLCGTVIIELIAWLSASANSQTVDFQRDIQPLLAEKCLHCHGTDAATRQGGLRLDDAAAAERGGDSGPAFVVGNSKASRLIERIHSTDADVVMPPPKEGKPLTDREKKLLADWIDQGAVYSKHWAFEAPKKLPLPGSQPDGNDAAAVHPIDAWVRHGLATQKLKPNPPAPDYAVCRRLYLDLTGLPPSPEQVEAYRRDGHTATVEALLSSPRYGEKWARHWLDVARYSDTNGYEKDLQRDQWIWRDWVVNAFNDDMPYDQFIVRQIAGDLLPDATQNDLIATGFLRNSMLNEEGAIVPEQFRMVEMFDRMDCIGKGILGLSTQCAQCHTHKFDPITQSEYYGMFAFLNNAYEAQSWIYDAGQQQTLQQAHAEIDRLIATAKSKLPDAEGGLAQWLADVQSKQGNWRPVKFDDLGSISGLNHPVQLDDHSVLMLGHTSADVFMSGVVPAMNATGLRLELLTHGDLPFRGPGRSRTGTWQIHELELFVKTPGSDQWQKQKLVAATADFSESEVADKEGKKRTGPVAFLVDGSDDTTWQADRGGGLRNHPSVAVMQLEKPLALVEGSQIKIAMRMGNMPGCVRFSLTEDAEPRAPVVLWEALQEQLEPNQAAQAQGGQDQPKLEERKQRERLLATHWIAAQESLKEDAKALLAAWAKIPSGYTSVLHLAERTGNKVRITRHLDRGNWDQPQEPIAPHTPAAFHPLSDTQPKNRLAFAQWLVDRRSPLAARVAVNRVWQAIFGEGLVETAEDFGTRASQPEYRELLDWLAVDFMEQNWSHKQLLRRIVSSATYQQSSVASPEAMQVDPRNRWLSRGPRFRADAEVVRDMAMSISGLITHKLGGPSVIPPVPQNVLDYNYVYPSYWKPATGPERYRRTLYGFRKRSMPDPVMSNLDAPNADFSCARRVRSNTPLAALTGLNETIFFECAQGLGLRILREGGSSDASRIDRAYMLCMSRPATEAEQQEVTKTLARYRGRLAEGWLNPREIITGDPSKLPDLPPGTTPQDAAAWVLLSRVLLNLDETISK